MGGKIPDVARMMIGRDHLIALADVYQAAKPMPDTTLSHRVFKDSKKLAAMRAGGDITTGRYEEALRYFADNWPDGVDWPTDVPHPARAAA